MQPPHASEAFIDLVSGHREIHSKGVIMMSSLMCSSIGRQRTGECVTGSPCGRFRIPSP